MGDPDNQGSPIQVHEGEWHRIRRRKQKIQCCDCGMVHYHDYRVSPRGHLEFRVYVDRRATAAVRRAFKFEKDEE